MFLWKWKIGTGTFFSPKLILYQFLLRGIHCSFFFLNDFCSYKTRDSNPIVLLETIENSSSKPTVFVLLSYKIKNIGPLKSSNTREFFLKYAPRAKPLEQYTRRSIFKIAQFALGSFFQISNRFKIVEQFAEKIPLLKMNCPIKSLVHRRSFVSAAYLWGITRKQNPSRVQV